MTDTNMSNSGIGFTIIVSCLFTIAAVVISLSVFALSTESCLSGGGAYVKETGDVMFHCVKEKP